MVDNAVVVAGEPIGERAIAAHPDSSVGYLALGKAAKVIRDDEAMIRWHTAALDRDDALPDAHYDLALVRHGREGEGRLAVAHYRKVLEHAPTHPRRETLEAWIRALEGTNEEGR